MTTQRPALRNLLLPLLVFGRWFYVAHADDVATQVIDIRGLSFRWQLQGPVVLALDGLRID